MPVQASDLDDLVAALPAGEKAAAFTVEVAAPDLARDNQQEDHADGYVGAVEPSDHEKARAELWCAPRITPRPHAFHDQLGPFERLHADKGRAEGGCAKHQDRRLHAIAPVAIIDRHRHRAAAADQDEGHDGDQDQGNFSAADRQGEDFAGVRPGIGSRHSDRHVREQQTTENEGVAQEENPHHRLAPGDALEGPLIRGPVRVIERQPTVCWSPLVVCRVRSRTWRLPFLSHICLQRTAKSSAHPMSRAIKTSHTTSRKFQ